MPKTNNPNFKFLLLNKNNADLKNRIDQINHVLETKKPDFFVLNEAQLHKHDTTTRYQFPGYCMENDNLNITDGWSRTAILVKNSIKYKRQKDLEIKGIATVWLQVGIPGTKHFLLQALYRQFRRQGKAGTNSISSQEERWTSIITKWQEAMKEGREVITLGDTNIDSLVWEKHLGNYANIRQTETKHV